MQLFDLFVLVFGPVLFLAHAVFAVWVYKEGDWEQMRSASISMLVLLPFFLIFLIELFISSGVIADDLSKWSVLGFICVPFGLFALISIRLYVNIFAAVVVIFLIIRWYNLIILQDHLWVIFAPWMMIGWTIFLAVNDYFDTPSQTATQSSAMPNQPIQLTIPPVDPLDDFERPPARIHE